MVLAAGCAACRIPLAGLFTGPVCAACWAAVRGIAPPLCHRCGTPLAHRARRHACHVCRGSSSRVAMQRSAGEYDGALRAIIHAFKYDRHTTLAAPLGRLIRDRCSEALRGADACVPVPLHWRRRLTRGFNQAHLLARELGLPVWPALGRRRHTRAQASLQADDRRSNVASAFEGRRWIWAEPPSAPGLCRRRLLPTRESVRGATLALVDDVTTTGATIDACAAVLLAMGASEVRAVTIARVEVQAGR